MFSAIIVDDEELARKTLQGFLKNHCPEVTILGTAESADAGFYLVNTLNPDVVFLDIEMPMKNGFDFLNMFENVSFKTIFTTAYGHYAIDAIKYSALDYILKPLDIEELKDSVKKAEGALNEESDATQIQTLLKNLKSEEDLQQIVIPEMDGFKIMKVDEILYIKSDKVYSEIYHKDSMIVSSKSLKEYDNLLSSNGFFRINKSHLLNISKVKEYKKGEGGTAIMENGMEIEVSRRRKKDFLSLFI